jgi:two-component system chemotaxis response regulator CheB
MSQFGIQNSNFNQANPIKVLVVDDSAFMRKMVSQILSQTPGIVVVGQARDGVDAMNQLPIAKPDVITLDIEMPNMDGVECLKCIMDSRPTPVVMISSLTRAGAEITIKCLENGAVDFVCKPSGSISLDIETVGLEIVSKVQMAAGIKIRPQLSHFTPRPIMSHEKETFSASQNAAIQSSNVPRKSTFSDCGVLVIGASTGGPRALQTVISALPGDLGVPVVIVQHMPPTFTASFAARLNQLSGLDISEAKASDELKVNHALVAPGGFHLEFNERKQVKLTSEPPIHGVRPSVDITIASLSKIFGSHTCAVLLTGMGRDGARGLKTIRDLGGHTVAEDESSCVIFGMPKAAIELDGVDQVLPLEQIAEHVVKQIKSSNRSRCAA